MPNSFSSGIVLPPPSEYGLLRLLDRLPLSTEPRTFSILLDRNRGGRSRPWLLSSATELGNRSRGRLLVQCIEPMVQANGGDGRDLRADADRAGGF